MTTAEQDPEDGTAAPAVGIPLDRKVRALADRLRDLNEAFRDDEGRDLDSEIALRVIDFAARHTEPEGVSAGPDGSICFSWGRKLSMQFAPAGRTYWAGKSPLGQRTFGRGEPDPLLWPCLRSNV